MRILVVLFVVGIVVLIVVATCSMRKKGYSIGKIFLTVTILITLVCAPGMVVGGIMNITSCDGCFVTTNDCPSCNGLGKFKISETKWMTCPTCKGTGRDKK